MRAIRFSIPVLSLIVVLLSASAVLAQVPEWQWAVRAGGSDQDYGWSAALDGDGNIFVTGNFMGTATFGATTLTSAGDKDVFIAKLDAGGGWLWAKRAGGPGLDWGKDITADGAGNCIVTGHFSEAAWFGPDSLASSGDSDIFAAKLDAAGNWLWARRAGGTNTDNGNGLVTEPGGNIFLTGAFYGPASFGDINVPSIGGCGMFVARLDSDGNWSWVVSVAHAWGERIAVSGGDIYITGAFSTTSFNGIDLVSSGLNDIFVAKMDAQCNWIWASRAGGSGFDAGNDLALDGVGNCYVTGDFAGTADFGSTVLTDLDWYAAFVAKVDDNGNWVWAKQLTGDSIGQGVALDGGGSAFCTGYYYGPAGIGDIVLPNSGQADIYLVKLDPAGNWQWAAQAGGSQSDIASALITNGSGDFYLTGEFGGTTHFGDMPLTCQGYCDIFVTRFYSAPVASQDDILPSAPEQPTLSHVCPNPCRPGDRASIEAVLPARAAGTLALYNLRGQLIRNYRLQPGQNQVFLHTESLPAGLYFCRLQSGGFASTRKLVLVR